MLSQGSTGFVFWGLFFFFCDIYESIQVYVNVCVPENRRTFKRSIFFLFNLMTRLYDHDFFFLIKNPPTRLIFEICFYTQVKQSKNYQFLVKCCHTLPVLRFEGFIPHGGTHHIAPYLVFKILK